VGGAKASGGTVGQGGASQGGATGCAGTPTLGTVAPAALYAELQQPGRSFLLINVRTPVNGNIPGTDADIAYTDTPGLEAFIGSDKSRAVTLYCETGHTSSIAGAALVSNGYCNVRYLVGGISAWETAGYPVTP
jgi:rhodanese-related sulfurtransferase